MSSSTPRSDSGPAKSPERGPTEQGGRPRRRTQEERRNQAERALLDAAARLFARRGVDQTSLAEVGEEAGYSRGLANHHFGSKAALVERLAHRSQRDFVAGLGDIGGHELRALLSMIQAYLAGVSENSGQTRAFFVVWGAALPAEAALRPVFVTDDARFRDGVEVLVRAGQAHRTIRAEADPAGVAVALVGLLRGTAAQFLIDPQGVDLDAAGATCKQFVRYTLDPTRAATNEAQPEERKL
ncbi:TetR/AcrR family transcriptional regulator [Pseudonocardia sp.]|uniref:TetR/AcrR family transcriptional regulator n=1 Tax=Pseudonocardia sp. TaxID=60912 RepID=UPI0031FDA90C